MDNIKCQQVQIWEILIQQGSGLPKFQTVADAWDLAGIIAKNPHHKMRSKLINNQ